MTHTYTVELDKPTSTTLCSCGLPLAECEQYKDEDEIVRDISSDNTNKIKINLSY